jgi:hypothetical protein
MITNTGKDIIAKYLLGQAPAYASHIAVGCGKKALPNSESLAAYREEFAFKKSLDFEMFRVPIISRGYITELDTANAATITGVTSNGIEIVYTANNVFTPGDIVSINGTNVIDFNIQNATVFAATPTSFTVKANASGSYVSGGLAIGQISKVVLTAELPTEQRYEISEIGLYSAKSNPSATSKDSRMLYSFSETENWEYHGPTSAIGIGPAISTPLYAGSPGTGIINPDLGIADAFRATANNAIFDSAVRLDKNERSRFLNSALYVPGNMSDIQKTDGVMFVRDDSFGNYGTHIHLAGTTVSLSQNSPEDEIRLAFSIINKDESYDVVPSKAHILIQFTPEEGSADAENFASFQVELNDTDSVFDLDNNTMASNRYHVVSSKLGDLIKGTNFTWGSVRVIKIYSSIFNSINVIGKELTDNVAKLTTQKEHGFVPGSVVVIDGVDATFNGTYKVIDAPSSTTFTYAKTSTNLSYTSASGTAEGPSSNYFVGLDALRLENVSTLNPLYGLTGYSVIRTANARPIIKDANSSNLIEFRFGLDVL